MSGTSFDVVVVGAGTAGCAIAARLSEDADRTVLLLEAGPDYRPDELPEIPLDGTQGAGTAGHDWGLVGAASGRELSLPRGKVVGGSSAVNATFALRGSPLDYDAWGIPGWSWAELMPEFIALERDLDFGSAAYHGSGGPVPVRRYLGGERSPLTVAVTDALAATGVPVIEDHNAPYAVGVSALPVNSLDGRRMSMALTHLEPARGRPNLTVCAGAEVARVLTRAHRAVGVELIDGRVFAAGEVIVCGGAYCSPQLLRRSGIERPGLGANLSDHPAVSIDLPYVGEPTGQACFQVVATLHSSLADPATEPPDVQVLCGGPWPSGGGQWICFVGAALLKPRSRGKVGEQIEMGYFDVPDDLARLAEGVAVAEHVVASPLVRAVTGPRLEPRPDSPAATRSWLRRAVWSYHHPVGTCAMGSVVDADCRVDGLDGLRVVDASVLPEVPSANTNLPTLAVAEHFARRYRQVQTESLVAAAQ